MKKSLAMLVLVSTVFLTGCTKSVALTQVESDTLSDYMTNIVLKYEENYDNKLFTLEEIAQIEAKAVAREQRFDAIKLKSESNIKDEDSQSIPKDNPMEKEVSKDDTIDKEESKNSNKSSLTKTIGSGTFKINYKAHKIVDSYKGTDSPVEVVASKGKSLLLVTFDVENSDKNNRVFDLVEENIEYQLKLSNGTVLKPITTLLTYDIQFFNMNISGGTKEEALILFEMDKNMAVENSSLSVIKNDLSHNVVLK